jgi:hypothetical protein
MRRVAAYLACLFVLLTMAGRAVGQPFAHVNDPYHKAMLITPPGVRNLAFGWGSGAADPADPANVFYNPAIMVAAEGLHAGWNSTNWPYNDIGDFTDFGISGRIPIEKWDRVNLAGSVRYERFESFTYEFVDGLGAPATFYDSADWYLSISLAAGYLTEAFQGGVGISVKPYSMELTHGDRESAWAMDAGLFARGRVLYVSGGASILNGWGDDIVTDRATSTLPDYGRVAAGVLYETPPFGDSGRFSRTPAVTLFAHIENVAQDIGASDETVFGGEIGFVDLFFLRIGHSDQGDFDTDSYGAGLAWRFAAVRVAADFAYRPMEDNFFSGDMSTSAIGLSALWPY